MSTSWGRRLAGGLLVSAIAVTTACGPEPGGGGAPSEVRSGSLSGMPGASTVAGPVCVEADAVVVVTVADATSTVRIRLAGSPPEAERYTYGSGGSVRFGVAAGCHTFTLDMPLGVSDPEGDGGSFNWTITGPVPGPVLSSPFSGQIGRQTSPSSASHLSEEVCLPVGSGVEVGSPDPAGAPLVTMLFPPPAGANEGAWTPLPPGTSVVLTTVEPCQKVLVVRATFGSLDATITPFTITFPVPAPPSSQSATISTTGAEPVGTVLWSSAPYCPTPTGLANLSINGNSTSVGAASRASGAPIPFDPTGFNLSIVPAGGGQRIVRGVYSCFSVELVQQPDGVGVAQTFDVNLTWTIPAPTSPWTNTLDASGGATDVVCSEGPSPAQTVTIAGATGPWTVTRHNVGKTDGTISGGAGDTTASFPTGTYGRCARFVVEHTPAAGAEDDPLIVTVAF